MTTLIDTVKKAKIQAFKDKDEVKNTLLSTVIGDAGTKAKNDKDRPVADADVVSVMKKILTGIEDNFKTFEKYPVTKAEDIAKREVETVKMNKEKAILLELIPPTPNQMTEDQLRAEIQKIMQEQSLASPKAMGVIMKELKANFADQYDGGMASKLAKELLA
jgi:uncharacterized protein YqeY